LSSRAALTGLDRADGDETSRGVLDIGERHSANFRGLTPKNMGKQAKLVGVLYIENNVAASVFTPARIAVLKLLASQAAISLDNARLYGELAMSEERWRKLFESVPVGVALLGSDRRAANPAFQRMLGYSCAATIKLAGSPTIILAG
jgi:PAS domain-containing protein